MNDEEIASEVERIHQLGIKNKNIECFQESKKIKQFIAEARASEQDKAKAIQILAFEQGIAEGYNHGQASVMATCSDCQKVQRKKGQADLKHKETKPENAFQYCKTGEHQPTEYTMKGGYTRCGKCNVFYKETKPENACKKKNPNMSRIQSWHRVYRITKLGEKLMNKTKPENAYERPKRHNTYLRSREYSKQKVLRNKERYHVMVAKYPLKETKPEKKVKP